MNEPLEELIGRLVPFFNIKLLSLSLVQFDLGKYLFTKLNKDLSFYAELNESVYALFNKRTISSNSALK